MIVSSYSMVYNYDSYKVVEKSKVQLNSIHKSGIKYIEIFQLSHIIYCHDYSIWDIKYGNGLNYNLFSLTRYLFIQHNYIIIVCFICNLNQFRNVYYVVNIQKHFCLYYLSLAYILYSE